ncbi:MAG: SRPBCC family protein [Candidatus Omnitrophota bacterium]|nr:SRPBCC family protein [Candidatus Omnitrophota bacterium]MDZ4241629.1 SRPBCC family protein [Candidatus Omnitrophota bacterium]
MTAAKKSPKKQGESIQQFVFIEVPFPMVSAELELWGEAAWWPKICPLQIRRTAGGTAQVGTTFENRILKSAVRPWVSEITRMVPGRLLELTFKQGPLKGREVIRIGERANGARVDYESEYQVTGGFFNGIVWGLGGKKPYENGIKLILAAFKDYVVRKSQMPEPDQTQGQP